MLAKRLGEPSRIALTANHVVRGQETSSIKFITQAGVTIPVTNVDGDEDLDVAVLHLSRDGPEGLAVSDAKMDAEWMVTAQPLPKDIQLDGTIEAVDRPWPSAQGRKLRALQLHVINGAGDYAGYSGSPVVLKSTPDAVVGVLIEQAPQRIRQPIGAPKPLSANALYAIPIHDVIDHFELTAASAPQVNSGLEFGTAPSYPHVLVGRDNDLDALRNRLTDIATSETTVSTRKFVVYGWPGVGKTTLAAALAHDRSVSNAFPDGVLWVSLGQDPNLHSELAGWARALNSDLQIETREDVEKASHRLRALLRDERRLLIVDDVWESWHANPFTIGGKSCATLFTTRVDKVRTRSGGVG